MFKTGDVVYHDNLVFADMCKDPKKRRPCIVLYTVEEDGEMKVCTCPLTSNVNAFLKRTEQYLFIPYTIYNSNKVSFAKIDNIKLHPESQTHHTGISLDEEIVDKIVQKFLELKIYAITFEDFNKLLLTIFKLVCEMEEDNSKLILKNSKSKCS